MIIGDRLKVVRESKKMSQGDIEKKTGLLRCYISRVENGHTVPAIETLEKMARAMEIPMWHLFYEAEKNGVPESVPDYKEAPPRRKASREILLLERHMERLDDRDCRILLQMARHMATGERRKQANGTHVRRGNQRPQ